MSNHVLLIFLIQGLADSVTNCGGRVLIVFGGLERGERVEGPIITLVVQVAPRKV